MDLNENPLQGVITVKLVAAFEAAPSAFVRVKDVAKISLSDFLTDGIGISVLFQHNLIYLS